MKIIQMTQYTPQQNTGFIIITNEGFVIAVDGGCKGDKDGFIRRLQNETGKEVPHIDAWFITHPHDDHYGVFTEIVKMQEKGETIPDVAFVAYGYEPDEFGEKEKIFAGQIVEFNDAVRRTKYPTHIMALDEEWQFGSLNIRIILMPDLNETHNAFNNASCVMKLTEKREGKEDFTVIILGDLGVEGGNRLVERFPEGLKANAVQMAHHGQNGCDRNVYEAIHPEYAFFCTPDWLWTNTIDPANPGKGPWKTLAVRSWMEEIGAEPVRAVGEDTVFVTDDL